MVLKSVLGTVVIGLGCGALWGVGAFFSAFFAPFFSSASTAIWQAKVPPDVQGRVFSVRGLLSQGTAPLALLLVGPVTDQVFEPTMMPGGSLAHLFGWLIQPRVGAGMLLIQVLVGLLGIVTVLAASAFSALRQFDERMPDRVAVTETLAEN
jgi:hypothetical protein